MADFARRSMSGWVVDPLPAGHRLVQCGDSLMLRAMPHDPEPDMTKAAAQESQYQIAGWHVRQRSPDERYNCAGLVLASRRGHITDESMSSPEFRIGFLDSLDRVLPAALAADGYRRLDPTAQAAVGDIVTYKRDGSYEHIGLVVGFQPGGLRAEPVPVVWSKWGWRRVVARDRGHP